MFSKCLWFNSEALSYTVSRVWFEHAQAQSLTCSFEKGRAWDTLLRSPEGEVPVGLPNLQAVCRFLSSCGARSEATVKGERRSAGHCAASELLQLQRKTSPL